MGLLVSTSVSGNAPNSSIQASVPFDTELDDDLLSTRNPEPEEERIHRRQETVIGEQPTITSPFLIELENLESEEEKRRRRKQAIVITQQPTRTDDPSGYVGYQSHHDETNASSCWDCCDCDGDCDCGDCDGGDNGGDCGDNDGGDGDCGDAGGGGDCGGDGGGGDCD
jgi:hypothetical protein